MNGSGKEENMEKANEAVVLMWGYLPGASPQRSPLLSPASVRFPATGDSWKDVCGGGCGFAMAISEKGKVLTWGSSDDQGQSYLTSGKHGETPEPFQLPTEAPIVKAAAGWAHCVSVTGEVYTWGWKECVPSGKFVCDFSSGGSSEKESYGKQSPVLNDQASSESQGSKENTATATEYSPEIRKSGEERIKRRRIASSKEEPESSTSADETLSAPPCLVTLDPGVKITSVAAGGRHTLALSVSDVGQVWGWGYGGEGQLGLGSRIKMVSYPHLIPCTEPSSLEKDRYSVVKHGSVGSTTRTLKASGTYIKFIACGGRHSAVITDAGALLTFGWGLYGQCGQGDTNDVLKPTCVSSLLGTKIKGIAAGLWHTLCISVEGRVHAFGGNQFGQLGTGSDQSEDLPRLLNVPSLENKRAKVVSCGARHSAILTEDGKVYSWGWNKYGQLGVGEPVDWNIPSEVPIEGYVPKNLACGWWHTLLLAET
ncbi:ultraviolet-B receptor UVR8-like isoform X3 [Diospyros lotus]|uniref:ultraviolet-B receptor UVR8-like isoform X3 n=1 Tax=Diospyros lotus TaxID=55363 RepID=UPI0022522E7B|nr:ultraviolet-B receptor UVR8-like isoform X3 [Diospyros lotus]